MRAHHIAIALIPALLAVLLGAWFMLGSGAFCLDDAYIHLAYARSLSRGEGLSYNPLDLETGSSSPLWALALAPLVDGADPVARVQVLGVALHALSAALAARLVDALAARDASITPRSRLFASVAAGGLVAANPALLQGAISGMEVSLACALLLALAHSALAGRTQTALLVGALAVLARPEALFFAGGLSSALLVSRRTLSTLAPLAGAALGMLAWCGYCFAVSGYPWPNTKYAKEVGFGPSGLAYLLAQVLPEEPWLLGVGGLVLAVAAFTRGDASARTGARVLALAWLVSVAAIAVSRPLAPLVLFYASRYFAIVAAVPAVVVALGLVRLPRTLGVLSLLAVLVANVHLVTLTHARARAQERSVARLHVEPARYLAASLPADSVVMVEGAGATRYFAPRTMIMLDMLGLNLGAVAHARDGREKLCALLAHRPTHLLVPEELRGITVPLRLRPLRSFFDPSYAIGLHSVPRRVELFAVEGMARGFAGLCAGGARPR